MKRLIVGEKELFVNDYPVASVPYLGFGYDYLYYEPEGDNLFKIVEVGSDSIRVALTEQEIQLCSDFCDAYQPEIIPTPAPEPEKDTTSVFFVGTNGKPGGMKPRCDLQEGEIEITKAVYLTSSFFNSVVPEPIWDQQRGEFVGETYADKRLFAYYNELQYNI
jgi:hypothetical protein